MWLLLLLLLLLLLWLSREPSFGYVAAQFALLFSLVLQGSLCLVAFVSDLALGVISSHSASETCRSENQQCIVLEITPNSCLSLIYSPIRNAFRLTAISRGYMLHSA